MTVHPAKLALGLITPPLMAAAGWLVAAAGKYGIHLDQTGVVALFAAGASAAAAISLKLIHDVERELQRRHWITQAQVDHAIELAEGAIEPAHPPPAAPAASETRAEPEPAAPPPWVQQ